MPDEFYAEVVPGDFRQGDIFSETISIWLTSPDPSVLRPRQGRGGAELYSIHTDEQPPPGGLRWDTKETIAAEAKKSFAIVITHDCEIENEDDERYRQVAIVRPLEFIGSLADREAIIDGRHIGRLYLPELPEAPFPESYADFRAITTLRRDGLDVERRVAGLSDYGRSVLQAKLIAYFTELSPPLDE